MTFSEWWDSEDGIHARILDDERILAESAWDAAISWTGWTVITDCLAFTVHDPDPDA